jgi:hypothetical protein
VGLLGCKHDWSEWEYENPNSYALDLEDMYRYCSRCHAEQCKSWLEIKRENRRARHFAAQGRIAELEAENARLDAQLRGMGITP